MAFGTEDWILKALENYSEPDRLALLILGESEQRTIEKVLGLYYFAVVVAAR
jgi:hypothetical protein